MAVVISLVFTPINIDALIIPKVALLFTLAMYILPELVTKIKEFSKRKICESKSNRTYDRPGTISSG